MTLSQAQLNALYGVNDMTPDQSATVLGHANSFLGQNLNKPPTAAFSPQGLAQLPGQIGGAIGGIANDALKFGQSAAKAPMDIVNAAQGKSVNTNTLPNFTGEGQQTFQGEFQSKTLPAVEAGTESPLKATAATFGGVLASAANFLGLGAGGKAAAEAAPQVAKDVVTTSSKVAEKKSVDLATSRVSATADMMTKNELASEASRVTPSGKLLPSATEQRAGELLKGQTYSNPTKTLASIKNEISTRGQEAEQFLGQNGKPISNEEDLQMFQTARDKAAKYLSPAQLNGYDHAITQFQSELKGMGNMNTGTYYKALKNFEQNVTANLPKGTEAIMSDTVSGQMIGAKTVRQAVRDMIGAKNPEFKQKMFDLASLYDAQDNVSTGVANLAKGSTTFAKRHPVITGAAKYGAEAVGAGALYEGAKELGAPLP